MKAKILFLAANPKGTTQLALGKEFREIAQKIRAGEHRDKLELIPGLAVRPEDLLQLLNVHKPHVVHFSGHGSQNDEIVLEDDHGNPFTVSALTLTELFKVLKDNVRVVVLNACFSQSQAKAITEVIDCAIGMNRSIGDEAAIIFAAAFYQAIAFGRSIEAAWSSGKVALRLANIPETDRPKLLSREGIDPATVCLIDSIPSISDPQ